jgi:mycothiol synthase
MLQARMYRKDDYDKIIHFLREIYKMNKNQHCWLPTRWEYAEHLVNPLFVERGHKDWEPLIRIWEENDRIVGIVHPEDTHNAFIQIRPGYRLVEEEMIEWAEKNIALPFGDGRKKIVIWVNESDTYRKDLLKERGYSKGKECSYLNVQSDFSPVEIKIPADYIIRSMAEEIDLVKRFNVTQQAFNPKAEYQKEIPGSFLKMIKAPMYRSDLDIVAEYKDGTLAASCTVWYDEELNFGMFEPVATHPKHQRKGLGKAIVSEGLNRLEKLGVKTAYVESFGDNRYSFYSSVGFKAYDQDYPWTKIL